MSILLRKISVQFSNLTNSFRPCKPISIETLKNAQNSLDLSNNALLDLAASLRTDNVKIEAGLREDLYESGTIFKDHFDVKEAYL